MSTVPTERETSKNVFYTIHRWELHPTPEGERDYLFIAVNIQDKERRPDTKNEEFTVVSALLNSWPEDDKEMNAVALEWLDEKVDEAHYNWLQTPLPKPPPLILTPAEISTLVLGKKADEEPVRQLKSTHIERGTKPKGVNEQDRSRGIPPSTVREDISPFKFKKKDESSEQPSQQPQDISSGEVLVPATTTPSVDKAAGVTKEKEKGK